MIPTTYERWLDGAPWHLFTDQGNEHTAFHHYWMQVHTGKRTAEPLVCFRDPHSAMHEVAHLICAADENVLSPTWGLGPMGDPYSELGTAHRTEELGVIYVQTLIEAHVESWEGNHLYRRSTIIRNTAYSMAGAWKLSPWERKNMMRYIMTRFPNIETVWSELQRKCTLIAALMEES